MVHSDILISGSKTIIYVIKERSVQAANLSDLRVLLVCVVCFFYRGTFAHHFETVAGGKMESLMLVNMFFLRTLFLQVLVTHSMSLGLYLSWRLDSVPFAERLLSNLVYLLIYCCMFAMVFGMIC